jgi:ribose transport system permease protein
MSELKSESSVFSVFIRNNTMLVAAVLLLFCTISSVASPYFLTKYNLQALMRDLAFISIVAVGQSVLLLLGELDLSVGAMASLSGILCGLLMTQLHIPPIAALPLGLIIGLCMGGLNGLIITVFRLNAMVATIGMAGVYAGITLVLTKGKAVTGIPPAILFIGQSSIGLLPIPFVASILVTISAFVFVTKTKAGRYIYAIGNSKPAAEMLGIKVNRIRMISFGIVGFLAALSGILYVARLGSAQTNIGTNWPMNSIAASVIGGILLTGGVGNPIGAYMGAAIICVISNIIVLLGVNMYWQQAVSGVVVVVAIALPSILNASREKKRIKKIVSLERKG